MRNLVQQKYCRNLFEDVLRTRMILAKAVNTRQLSKWVCHIYVWKKFNTYTFTGLCLCEAVTREQAIECMCHGRRRCSPRVTRSEEKRRMESCCQTADQQELLWMWVFNNVAVSQGLKIVACKFPSAHTTVQFHNMQRVTKLNCAATMSLHHYSSS